MVTTLLRDRYKIIDLLSHHTGFGITYKVKDSNHPNQPIRILKQLKKPTVSKRVFDSVHEVCRIPAGAGGIRHSVALAIKY